MIATLYYAILFIIALYFIGRILAGAEYVSGSEEEHGQSYIIICSAYVLLCLFTVIVSVSTSEVIDRASLYFAEFFRIWILINGAELVALITEKKKAKQMTIVAVASELFYLGIAVLALRTVLDRAKTQMGIFGKSFVTGNAIGLVIYITVDVVILFIYAAYTYMFYYSCTRKRENYLLKRCIIVVAVLAVSILVEAIGYFRFDIYIPIMNLGMLVCINLFRNMLIYKRTIEYNEQDYDRILSPSYKVPAFVCNDEGAIIFENVRAFVMKQTYKESNYVGGYLTDFFEISEYDKDRLNDPRVTQVFDVYCRYPKEPKEVILRVKHNIDRYGEIFSSEVEYLISDEKTDEEADTVYNAGMRQSSRENRLELLFEDVNQMRVEALVGLLEDQRMLYDKNERLLFDFNLIGIIKMAEVMRMAGLVELCERIREATIYTGEWDSIDMMLIDLDRQYETLKLIR